MKQVAEYAGVSTATVARVLHNNGYVSDEAREKVEMVIRNTGYQLNTVAQSLRQQRTYTIAHILESTTPNPFFVHVSLGARQMAKHHNYHVLDYNVQHDSQFERQAVETFISRRVDAILFTTALDPQNVQLAIDSGIPVIQVEKPRVKHVDTIFVDNYCGVTQAIEHLIALGHQRIAFIGVEPGTIPGMAGYTDQERYSAYVDTLQTHKIELNNDYVAFGDIYLESDIASVGSGKELAHRLLGLPNPPSAIFVASDNAASGVMQAIYEHRLRVPDDISVIGFDDTYAPYLSPPLTTVKMPMIALGESAVEVAIQRIESSDESQNNKPISITLSTELIVRQSTGSVK